MQIMSRWTIAPLVGVAFLTSAACRERAEPPDRIPGDVAAPAPLPPEAQLSDGNIVAFVSSANQVEVNTARAALLRVRTRAVRELAQRVGEEHAGMQRSLDSLARAQNIVPVPPLAMEVVDDAMAARLDNLVQAPDAAADTAYVNAQVALDVILLENVTQFASAATDEELRLLLRGWIPMLQARITKARDVQRQLAP